MKNTKIQIDEYEPYKSIEDFKESLIYGKEIIIKWADTEYVIEYENNNEFSICESHKPETENRFNTIGLLLDYELKSGDTLRNVITKSIVVWRNV